MDGGPTGDVAVCPRERTGERMGRCTQDAGRARGQKTVRGQEFEYGDREMQKGESAVWSAADTPRTDPCANQRAGRGLPMWRAVRPSGPGGDQDSAGISRFRGHAGGRKWKVAEAERGI